MTLARSLLLAALLGGCASPTPCTLDTECGAKAMCIHPTTNGRPSATGRCSPACISSFDCVMAGHPSESCLLVQSGQATNTLAYGLHRTDAVATPLDGMKACMRPDEAAR
jgi:hypothetical protein